MEPVFGYCVKCKQKVKIKNTEEVVAKNGRKMVKGICPVCGTKVSAFVK